MSRKSSPVKEGWGHQVAMKKCHLCDTMATLRESHIIPDWYYRDEIRDFKHGGQFIDMSREPASKHGRAIVYPLLCDACEQRFGNWDNAAKRFVTAGEDAYGPWMLRFATSISWRVLKYFSLTRDPASLHGVSHGETQETLDCWRDFLLHEKLSRRLSRHTQHLMRVGDDYRLRRIIGLSFEDDGSTHFVYARFGAFGIAGIVRSTYKGWKTSKSRLYGSSGKLPAANYGPTDFLRCLVALEKEYERRLRAHSAQDRTHSAR